MKVVPLDQGYHNSLGESLKGDAAEDILSPEFSEDRLALRSPIGTAKTFDMSLHGGNGLLGPAHIGRSKTRSPSLIWPAKFAAKLLQNATRRRYQIQLPRPKRLPQSRCWRDRIGVSRRPSINGMRTLGHSIRPLGLSTLKPVLWNRIAKLIMRPKSQPPDRASSVQGS